MHTCCVESVESEICTRAVWRVRYAHVLCDVVRYAHVLCGDMHTCCVM